MHVLKEKYIKKCGKDICGSELYAIVVSFCSKHNIFFKNNYEIGLLNENPR
jgi:spore cortex formation protein SpoVR/YcgB (stage V sporulation)